MMSSYNAQPSQEAIKRARELRAQGYALRAIERKMREEGHQISHVTIRKYTKDIYTPPQPKSKEEKRATRRAWYARNAKRLNMERREKRANETPEERAERLEYERLMRSLQKD
jgi:intein-encoded DNA endonuclease-like protein